MTLTAFLQRLQFLQTFTKKLQGLGKRFMGLPVVVRIGTTALAVVALALYVWFQSRSFVDVALLFGIVALVGGGLWAIGFVLRRRGERLSTEFDEELQGTEMLEELRSQWARAAGELESAGVDRYNMSFYMLIGEPQSGKTTTLQKSGLNFPIGMDKVSGIGGTRNLDWWFTDEAVILDTAGRLTFQEERTSDAEEWSEFLGLLSRYRPKCPVNGVIVTIPCTSLLDDDARTRERKAGVIRKALVEIERGLGVQFPVFVLLTKADRIGGFTEFFGRLRALEQTQLLGWSRPKSLFGEPFSATEVEGAFADLVARLRRWRVLLLDQHGDEMDAAERDRMVPFPEELAAIQGPLQSYLDQIFPESRLLEPLFLRGFYLTSGVQKGESILRAAARVLGPSATSEKTIARLGARTERAYFIRDFYRKKVFAERGLVVPTAARTRKVALIKRVGYGTAAAAALLGTVWVAIRWSAMRSDVVEPAERVEALADVYVPRAEGGAAPTRVLDELERLIELPSPAPEGGDLVAAGEGVVPAILRGDLLGTGGFLRVGAGQQEALRGGLVRSVRVGLVDGVLAPLADGAVLELEGLADAPSVGDRARRARGGIASFARMLLERERPAEVAPASSLDGFLELAAVRVEAGEHVAERADEVYAFLVDAHDPAYDDGLEGRSEAWRGLGLSAGVEHVTDRLRFVLPEALRDLREDSLRLAAPTGAAGDWFEPALVPARRPGGGFADEAAVAEALRAEGDAAERLTGYLYLRSAAISQEVNGALGRMADLEAQLAATRTVAAAEDVLAAHGDAWRADAELVARGLAELESITRVLPDGGLTVDVDAALLAALRSTNDFHADTLGFCRAADSSRLPWVLDAFAADGDGPWIALDDGPLGSARLALAGRVPLDWKAADGSVAPWLPIATVETLGSDDAPRFRIVRASGTASIRARIDEMRAILGHEADVRESLRALGVLRVSGDDAEALSLDFGAWSAEGDGPMTTLARSTTARAEAPATDPYAEAHTDARRVLARVVVGRALAALEEDLEAVALADALLGASREPDDVRPDRLDPDPSRSGEALDAAFADFVVPAARDLATAAEIANVDARTEALDRAVVRLLGAWETYWTTDFVAPLRASVREVSLSSGESWRRTKDAALGLFGASDARTWGARAASLGTRVRASMLGEDGRFLPSVDKAGIEGLARTSRRIGRIRDLSSERAELSAPNLESFAEVLTEERLDFGTRAGAMWRAELRDAERRTRLVRALEPLVRGSEVSPAGSDEPPADLFTAVDGELRTLGRAVRDAIGVELRAALVEDYDRLRTSRATEGFPFRAWDGDERSMPTDRELRDLFADVRGLVAMYRPLGLLPSAAPAPGTGLGEVFDGVAPAPERIVRAIDALEEVVALAGGGDDEGVRVRLRLLRPSSPDRIYLGIVRLSASTGSGSWAGDEGAKLAHLWRDEDVEKALEISAAAPRLALRFSRDPVGGSTGFDPDDSYGFVRASPDGPRVEPMLRYTGPLSILALIGEAETLSQSRIDVEYAPGTEERPSESVARLPLLVEFDPGRDPESDVEHDDSGLVEVELVVEGHRVPALPLELPEWR